MRAVHSTVAVAFVCAAVLAVGSCSKSNDATEGRLEALQIPARYASDLAVAKVLATAARAGALENVNINLDSIRDLAFKSVVSARLQALG